MRLIGRHRHHHALARGEAVGLDHDGRTRAVNVGMRGSRIGERGMRRRRDAMAHHEVFREILGAFELRRLLHRSENAVAGGLHGIDQARGERRLGPDHGQRDIIFFNKINYLLISIEDDILQPVLARGTGIARRDKHLLHPRRLREFPRQRVLAAAAADDEDFHLICEW